MKFFLLLYTANLLSEISVGYLLTTPMQSALRSKRKNDESNQVLRIFEMIELINGAYKDHGRNKANPKRVSRRFDLPTLVVNNLPASVVPKEDDKETQLEKIEEPVRYHVIDKPEVLEGNRDMQKKTKERLVRYLMKKPSSANIDHQNLEAKYSNTDAKLSSYHNNALLKAGLQNSTNITNTSDKLIQSSRLITNPTFEDGAQELTNIKPLYSPAFAGAGAARDMKQKVNTEDNAHTEDLDDTGPNKVVSQPLNSDSDDYNGQVTEKEEDKEMRTDNVNPKNNDYSVKNQGEMERKDTEPQHRSGSKKRRKHTTPVHGTSRKHRMKSNQDREEISLINGQNTNEHSHRSHKQKKYEKIYNYEKEVKDDKKRNIKEIQINNRDNQRYHYGHIFDRMEYEWNKRHLQYDKKYDANNDKERSIDDVLHDDWDERHNLIKKENNWKKRDNKNKKRDRKFNERDSSTWDRKLNMQENIDSIIEKEDARYLSNEKLNQSW